MMNKSFTNKVVVITGGSSGIGYAVADNLLGKGATVCLIARHADKLQSATTSLKQKHPNANIQYYSCDISDNNQVKRTIQEIANANNNQIDLVINNAGIGETGRFESQPLEVMHQVMNVNYWGQVHMTLAALPYLQKSGDAAIVFVSSIAGYMGLFGYTHYVHSKFAITGLAECLRMEFKDYNIPVMVIYPPDTATPMLERERAHTLPECRALSANAKVVPASLVASKLVNGVMKGKFDVYCNTESKMFRVLRVLVPGIFFGFVDDVVKKSRKKS